MSAVFPGLGASSGTWGDYDKDGDLDIILTGNLSDVGVAKIYRNDLNISNTLPAAPASPASFVNKSDVTLKWKSVRNDNTPYKAITYNLRVGTGSGTINIMAPNSTTSGLRRIVEQGNAGPDTTFLLKKMIFGTYYWSVQAVDNSFAGGPFSTEGTFTVSPVQASNLSARITSNNSLVLKWERGNGDRCAVFAKLASTGTASPANNTGYVADPEFGFGSQIGSSGWYCIYNGRDDSVSVTGLQYNKLYSFQIMEYMGSFGSEQYFTVTADGNPGVFSTSLFTEQTGITLNSGQYNNVYWGDYDNDGFIDILIPGLPNTRIYRNNGDNTFTEKTGISLPAVDYGSAKWGDYDNDGDLDIVITGATSNFDFKPSNPLTKIYRNDGGDVFTEQTGISLMPLFYSSVEWGDYDNDGDLDILINGASGTSPNYNRYSKIYENNGNNSFTEQSQIVLEGLYRGSVKWVDYDNDGDLDIAMTGAQMETQFNTEGVFLIYRNNGNKTFSGQTVSGITWQESNSSTSWGDFDNDGDLDFIMSARGIMTLYKNVGFNSFEEHFYLRLAFQGACYAAWGDYDNDGFLDFIISNPGLDTKIYRNTHGVQVSGGITSWFNRQDDDALKSVGYSFVTWADYDNDGDLDFLMSKEFGYPSKLFKNNLVMRSGLFKANSAPIAVTGLKYANTPNGVYLKWEPSADNQSPYQTLTYNVRFGTSKNNFNLTPSHSSATGYLKIPAPGNAQLDTTYLLLNMPAGKYYWSVQSVDQVFKGSTWSPVDSFEVKNVLAFFIADTVCQGLNTTFTNQSVGFGETITNYKWIFENGETSSLTSPSYSFGSAGVKNVTLIAYSSNTSDTIVKQVLVKGKPIVDFSSTVACLGIETSFTNLSDVSGLTISSWSWDYGDGKGSTAMSPGTHGYLNAGTYDVILNSDASNGCSNSITKTVSVAAYPVAAISATTPLSFCSGDSVVLSVASYTNHTYQWLSNGISLTGGTSNKLTAKNSGSYTAEIINLTGNCKTTSPAAAVTVLTAPAAPVITNTGLTTICQGDSLRLEAINNPNFSYQWKLNGGAVGNNSYMFYAKNSGSYSLTIANSNGCSVSSTNQISVTANPLPVAGNISHSGETRFCQGQNITLSIPLNANYTYNWKKGTAETGTSSNTISVNQPGDYSVVVTNSFGCKVTSSSLNVEVVNKPAKPEIDHGSFKNGDCLGETPLKLSVKTVSQEYTYKWYLNGAPISNNTFIETRNEGIYVLEASYDICKSDTAEFKFSPLATLPKPEIKTYGPAVWLLTTPSNAASYKWYYNGTTIAGATGRTYVAVSKTGVYMVAVADNSGCYSYSDTVRISMTGITGIEDHDLFKSLVLFPNPSSGTFFLKLENNQTGKLLVRIFNQNGKKVFDKEFNKTEDKFVQQIDISDESIGIFVISLYINGQFTSTKFIIEK
jgi:PKD repeat protein